MPVAVDVATRTGSDHRQGALMGMVVDVRSIGCMLVLVLVFNDHRVRDGTWREPPRGTTQATPDEGPAASEPEVPPAAGEADDDVHPKHDQGETDQALHNGVNGRWAPLPYLNRPHAHH